MKTALLVIDMQNDYLWEKRKERFSYDTAGLVASVNDLIREYHEIRMLFISATSFRIYLRTVFCSAIRLQELRVQNSTVVWILCRITVSTSI